MASPRTRQLIKAAPDVTRLSAALRSRRRLQEEAIRLHRGIAAAQERLAEIDEEEELLSAQIDEAGDKVVTAATPPQEDPAA